MKEEQIENYNKSQSFSMKAVVNSKSYFKTLKGIAI